MEYSNNYISNIESNERLKFEEARDLYLKAINTKNAKLSKVYMDKLILGTLYVVKEYIDNNDIYSMINPTIDYDELVNTFILAWIENVKKGKLLKVNFYSYLFDREFQANVSKSLVGSSVIYRDHFKIAKATFEDLLYKYIDYRNKHEYVDYNELIKQVNDYSPKYSILLSSSNVLYVLEKIYCHLNKDQLFDLDVSHTKINRYLNMIVDGALYEELTDKLYYDNQEDLIIDKITKEEFMEDINLSLPNKIHKKIIFDRFGLENQGIVISDKIGEELDYTGQRIRQLEILLLHRLRGSSKIKKYQNIVK